LTAIGVVLSGLKGLLVVGWGRDKLYVHRMDSVGFRGYFLGNQDTKKPPDLEGFLFNVCGL